MDIEHILDKSKLISELKEIHIELVEVYKKIFDYKYKTNETFKAFINKEHKENKISSKEMISWNDNFCHRASYTLLNKILFVRICEDKGFMLNIEDYIAGEPKDLHIGEKLSKTGLKKWANLITNYTLGELVKFAFLDMKKSYNNIVLYKEDKYEILNPTDDELSLKYLDGDEETKQIVLEFENVLNDIIEKLDTNTFYFKNSDGNILGDVYEKFMDRETRKSIGQFYTPENVIEYILNDTIAKVDVVKNPFVRIADISCGSGHFLIMAYDILKEKFRISLERLREIYANDIYVMKRNGKRKEIKGCEYWQEENIHYHILKNCIYGADIDSFAVQLTTINLLLKDLKNFTDELNIIECDSLIRWEEDYEWKNLQQQLEEKIETIEYSQINLFGEKEKIVVTQRKEIFTLKYRDLSGIEKTEHISKDKAEDIINVCSFWGKRFDYIVGNPPYMGQKGNKELFNRFRIHPYWRKYYERKQDVYYYFMIRGLESLNEGGKLGFINPPYWLTASASIKLKEYLLLKAELLKVYDFGDYKMFDDAQINGNIFIFLKNTLKDHEKKIKICKFNKRELVFTDNFSRYKNSDLGLESWNIFDLEGNENYFERSYYIKLKEIASIPQGIISGCDKVTQSHIQKYNLKDFLVNEGIYVLNQEEIRKFNKYEMKYVKPFYKNSDIDRYYSNTETEQYILITNEIHDIDKLPNIKNHLMKYKTIIDGRAKNFTLKKAYKEGKWYALTTYRPNINFEGEKLITPYRHKVSKFSYSDTPYYGCTDIFYLQVNDKNYNIFYILGILNSKLILYWLYNNCKMKGDNLELIAEPLGNIPIKKCEYGEQSIITNIVKRIIELKKDYYKQDNMQEVLNSTYIHSKFREMQRKLNIIDNEIEELENELNVNIYKLYNISKDEITNIEKFLTKKIPILKKENLLHEEIIDIKLYNHISSLMISKINCLIKELNYYCEVDKIKELLEKSDSRFEDIKDVMRVGDVTTRTEDMIIKWMNSQTYSWNLYRKAKLDNKIDKIFVNYPEKIQYGLTEWSDEIHKKYFLNAIEEYTINNPNEKKSKDLFELFKDLDIQDKQDYIEIIEGKIRRAFH